MNLPRHVEDIVAWIGREARRIWPSSDFRAFELPTARAVAFELRVRMADHQIVQAEITVSDEELYVSRASRDAMMKVIEEQLFHEIEERIYYASMPFSKSNYRAFEHRVSRQSMSENWWESPTQKIDAPYQSLKQEVAVEAKSDVPRWFRKIDLDD
jgi:hypothetical protein